MERRYQVFVSSTFLDLKDERAAVVSALLQMESMPAGMELFPAADDDAWTLIQRVIDSSDYYLLVIGGRYGATDPETELSYTEKEFDYAVSRGKPVMAFLHADPDSIPLGKSEKDDAARAKLDRFRTKVESTKHVKYWYGADDLAGKVALSFANFRQTYPAVGWVRGDVQTSTEALSELNELRKQLQTAEQKLEAARSGPPPGTERLAQGSDPVEFEAASEVSADTVKRDYGVRYSGAVDVDPSWDELFSAVGPELLDEVEQRRLHRRVNTWLTERYGAIARRDVRRALKRDDGDTVERFTGIKLTLSGDDFGTLLVQLRALGLVTRGERKRSVNDRGTYWTLTPYGDDHLTTLRAISRDDHEEGVDQEDADGEDVGNEDEDAEDAA
jgi:hypothetical protein